MCQYIELLSSDPLPPRLFQIHKISPQASSTFFIIVFCKFLACTDPAQSMVKPACIKNMTVAENIRKKMSTPTFKLSRS